MCAYPRPRIDIPCSKTLYGSKLRNCPIPFVNWLDLIIFMIRGGWSTLPTNNTHFTLPLKLYSKLDHHFFVNVPLLPYVVSSEINPITWSDHAPINLDIFLSAPKPKTCNWHLNESFLWNLKIQTQLQQKLSEFFQLNEVSDFHLLGKPIRPFSEVSASPRALV